MPCEDNEPIKCKLNNASEYGVLPPTLNIVAWPLSEGDCTPCVMENEIPSHGDGEQSTKFGGPWPNWPHPGLFCRFENEVPLPPAVGVGGGGVGLGLLESDTVICSGCC